MSPDICPNCGAEVPTKAKACPECGSDETTGWSEKAYSDNLNLPDKEFDYAAFVKEEFGAGRNKPHGIGWFWWGCAALLILALLFCFLR